MGLKKQIVNIISKDYYFREPSERSILLDDLEKADEASMEEIIRKFDDNHTHLFTSKYKVNDCLLWLLGTPYFHLKKDSFEYIKRIETIDGKKFDDIILNYRKKYPNTSQVNLEKYLSQDFFCSSSRITFGKSYSFNSENITDHVNRSELVDGLSIRNNRSSIVIKIFHFNNKNLISKLISLLSQIESGKIIILDLRNCWGGGILTAVKVSELFLSKSVELPYEITSKEGTFKRVVEGESKIERKRLLILVGKQTLSAAEFVLFQSLKSEGKCTSYGERTGGHSGQARIINLDEHDTFSYTVRRYIQDGQEITKGLEPDVGFSPKLSDMIDQKDVLLETLV